MQIEVLTISVEELDRRLDAAFQRNAQKESAKPDVAPSQSAPPFIDKREASRLLSCSPGTIDNFARAGKLSRHYVGKKAVRFDRQQVLSLTSARANHKL